jgi:hypothetical protein
LLKVDDPIDRIVTMTVIADTVHEKMNETRVQTLVKSWLAADDVFRPKFLQNILFIASEDRMSQIKDMQSRLGSLLGTEWISVVARSAENEGIASGPFIMWRGELCKAFRLYDDPQQAFVMATKPRIGKE